MELRELRYFVQIAKDGSYTKAAKSLYISQPALSKTIKKLEQEFQISLFETKPNGVVLTDYGQLLYARLLPLLEELDSLPSFIQDVQNIKQGILKVGITPMLNQLYINEIIVKFLQLYPNLTLKLIEGGTMTVHQLLLDGLLDIGICIVDSGRNLDSRLSEQILFEDSMIIAMSESNPLAKKGSLRFEELKNEAFHSYSTTSVLSVKVQDLCSKAGFTPKVVSTSSNVKMILQFTETGTGISLLPRPYAERYAASSLRLIPLEEPEPWSACLVKNKTAYQNYASRVFESCVVDYFSAPKFSSG